MRGGRRRTDANQAEIVAALRAAGCSVWLTYQLGHGAPDLVVGRAGARTVLMEVKATEDDLLTEDEERFFAAWRGGPLVVVRTAEEALWAMGIETGED